MKKAEGRRQKAEPRGCTWSRSTFNVLPSAFCLLVFIVFCAFPLSAANNLSVERNTLRVGEMLLITVSLEDEFAKLDDVRVPVRNLTIQEPPSIGSEFSWINGTVVRRKVFRFRARATTPGTATVGPVRLTAGDQQDVLPPIVVEVVADRAASSNDPAVILNELLATNREPMFIVAEQDAQSVVVGEQVIVTWYLYNGSSVQHWQIGAIPKLDDFWIEELDVRTARPSTVVVGGYAIEKMPVRRVALYPLRPGRLEIGPMEVEARVMRRRNRGPFAMFEGHLVEVGFSSAPLFVDAQPLPPGPPVAAVGSFSMRCTPPQQTNGGPVVLDAAVTGRGNLRAAQAPEFVSPPAGEVERIERGVTMQRSADTATMTRRWQYVIFPRDRGMMSIPALRLPVYSPDTNERRTLDCAAATLAVTAAERPRLADSPPPPSARPPARSLVLPIGAAAAVAILFLLFVMPWWRRRRALDDQIRTVMADQTPAEVRENVNALLARRGVDASTLVREPTDRGDAYRSLRSLLDALERDRIDVEDRDREIRRRIRELLLAGGN